MLVFTRIPGHFPPQPSSTVHDVILVSQVREIMVRGILLFVILVALAASCTPQTAEPRLLFGTGNSFTIMDADGTGRQHFSLPSDGRLGWALERTVSPDGEWLVFYTGSAEEPYDIALNMLNIPTGSSRLVSKLIAPEFPENLAPIAETIHFSEYDTICESDPDCRLSRVQSAFIQGIVNSQGIRWSPDSSLLAFAAQIDGPSSDIYILDIERHTIRRLTDDLENIWSIDWSPDGKKIVYKNSTPTGDYLSLSIHIADPMIELPQRPTAVDGGLFWFSYGWISPNEYLIYNGGEGAPPHRFRTINTETQEVNEVWRYSAESFYVDLKRNRIILSPYGRIYLRPEPETGIYTVSFDGHYRKISEEIVYFVEGQNAVVRYIAITQENQLVGVSPDGSITPLDRKPDYYVAPQASPDGKWIIITSESVTELYSGALDFIKSLEIHASDIIWRPDSAGVYLYDDPKLYYLSIMEPDQLLEVCAQSDCRPSEHVWLP